MNRLLSYYPCFALAILATMIIGCSGALSPLSVKIQNAELALEEANGFRIQSDDPKERIKEKAKREKLYDRAMKNYNTIIERSPDGKYAQRAHSGLAAIHQRHGRWDEATTHYQAIVDLSPTGYLGGNRPAAWAVSVPSPPAASSRSSASPAWPAKWKMATRSR